MSTVRPPLPGTRKTRTHAPTAGCVKPEAQQQARIVSKRVPSGETFGDWNFHGGGLHALPQGGNLGLHLDSDHHLLTGWKRAANAVLYLNECWEPDWGGELELYDARGERCVKRIAPRAGRLALFVPGDAAWHAVAPVAPTAQTRKTLAVFFWTQVPQDADRSTRPRA